MPDGFSDLGDFGWIAILLIVVLAVCVKLPTYREGLKDLDKDG